jgi:N utilization substance protein B
MPEAADPAGRRSRHPRRPRREARRLALDILYQADVTGSRPSRVLADREGAGPHVAPFAGELVLGVEEHQPELDRLIAAHLRGWTLERLAVVDRNVLRVATFELLHRPDVPPAAAIAEAVEMVKELSTEDSGRFVNGILGGIARDVAEPHGGSA